MSIVMSRASEFYTQTDRRLKRKQTEGIYSGDNILIQVIYLKVRIRRRLVLIHTVKIRVFMSFAIKKLCSKKLAYSGLGAWV